VRSDGLQEGGERRALERAEVAGGHVQQRGAVRTVARAHRDEPGGAGGVEHVLVQDRPRRDDADDLPRTIPGPEPGASTCSQMATL
jgi:hypothetical protein